MTRIKSAKPYTRGRCVKLLTGKTGRPRTHTRPEVRWLPSLRHDDYQRWFRTAASTEMQALRWPPTQGRRRWKVFCDLLWFMGTCSCGSVRWQQPVPPTTAPSARPSHLLQRRAGVDRTPRARHASLVWCQAWLASGCRRAAGGAPGCRDTGRVLASARWGEAWAWGRVRLAGRGSRD